MRVKTLVASLALATPLAAQVNTEVPPLVPGARPATVERVKIHGTALEGNLEGNAVDRNAIVFLPPSYAKETSRRYPSDMPSPTPSRSTPARTRARWPIASRTT